MSPVVADDGEVEVVVSGAVTVAGGTVAVVAVVPAPVAVSSVPQTVRPSSFGLRVGLRADAVQLRRHVADDGLGVLAAGDAVGGPLDLAGLLVEQVHGLVERPRQVVRRLERLQLVELLLLDGEARLQEAQDLVVPGRLVERLEAGVGVGADRVGLRAELVGAQRAAGVVAAAAAGDGDRGAHHGERGERAGADEGHAFLLAERTRGTIPAAPAVRAPRPGGSVRDSRESEKEPRMPVAPDVIESLNAQLGRELEAHLQYLAISSWFDSEGLPELTGSSRARPRRSTITR